MRVKKERAMTAVPAGMEAASVAKGEGVVVGEEPFL
jgi:hypothetical protein